MLKYCDKDGIEKTIIDSENINDYVSGSRVSDEIDQVGASTIRKGTFTFIPRSNQFCDATVTFTTPMPDADYEVIISWVTETGISMYGRVQRKTANGFDFEGYYSSELDRNMYGNQEVAYTAFKLFTLENSKPVECYHNVPRLVPKDIISYITDGTFWQRLNGTNGFKLFEDIYCGDYIRMSRPISAYERTGTYQTTGSQYVTIAGLDSLWGNGDSDGIDYHHAVMIPGQGFGGTQHFGRSRMNASDTTNGGYYNSEMNLATLGGVTSSGSTASTASINQQLYAEFGSHLKTTRELLSNSLNANGYNRYGAATGCTNGWAWYSCQAVLMSEVEVYGSTVWSSSGHDTGSACNQLPLFRHVNSARNNRSAWHWLKDVTNSVGFVRCAGSGYADNGSASVASVFVRPRFVIGA